MSSHTACTFGFCGIEQNKTLYLASFAFMHRIKPVDLDSVTFHRIKPVDLDSVTLHRIKPADLAFVATST